MGQACRGHNTGGSSWCSKGLCYHPDRPWQAGQMGGWEPHEVYKGKCKVSHTGSNNSLCQWKRPMGPRGSKTNQKSINMSLPQRGKKVSRAALWEVLTAHWEKWCFPFFQDWWKNNVECFSPVQGRYGDAGKCSKGPQRWLSPWSISHGKKH